MSATVLSEIAAPGITQITINRPDRRNALDHATYRGLIEALTAAERDEAARVIVLTGTGGCFTSGNDINDFAGASQDGLRLAMTFLSTLSTLRKPIIAAIEGFAVGIGTTLVLHCDLAFAGRSATFRLPFTALGLTPEGGSSLLLPQLAGSKRAAELLMLGEAFSAETAADAGLINAVVAPGEALPTALAKAGQLAALPPQALAITKMLLKRGQAAALAETIAIEAKHFSERLASAEAQAAFATFLKR